MHADIENIQILSLDNQRFPELSIESSGNELFAHYRETPEKLPVRRHIVERGRRLAADPGYPSDAILRRVAEILSEKVFVED